jgi:hypothetical protein
MVQTCTLRIVVCFPILQRQLLGSFHRTAGCVCVCVCAWSCVIVFVWYFVCIYVHACVHICAFMHEVMIDACTCMYDRCMYVYACKISTRTWNYVFMHACICLHISKKRFLFKNNISFIFKNTTAYVFCDDLEARRFFFFCRQFATRISIPTRERDLVDLRKSFVWEMSQEMSQESSHRYLLVKEIVGEAIARCCIQHIVVRNARLSCQNFLFVFVFLQTHTSQWVQDASM